MIISVGRWGSKAASHFFSYVADAFPTLDIRSCFARIAVVRDDIPGYELEWKKDAVDWPAMSGVRFPLDEDIDTQELWTPPRREFESAADQLYFNLGPSVIRRFAWLDVQDGWRQEANRTGFTVPAVAQQPQHWIAILGNVFEPEVATFLVRFVNKFQNRPPIVNTDCRYLFLVDAGLPDDPKDPTPWVDLPSWLAEEALCAIKELNSSYPAITYLLSERNGAGRTEAEGGRVAIAAGILRSLFCSGLLDSRTAPNGTPKSGYWNELAVLSPPSHVGMERVAHFIEFALDAENLPVIVAHEVLARWRKTITSIARQVDLAQIKADVLKALAGQESLDAVVGDWLKTWSSEGVAQSSLSQFQSALSWASDEQATDDAEFDRISALAKKQAESRAVESGGVWEWLKRLLKRLFGRKKDASPRDYIGEASAIKRRMMMREQIRDWLRFGAEFFAQVYREDGPFRDTIYKEHYDREDWDQRTIVLRLRRLPLNDDCPPAIQQIASSLTKELPNLMVEAARQSRSAETFIEVLDSALCRRFGDSFDSGDPTVRWNTFGFAQWLANDPELPLLVAKALCEQFVVPWRHIAGHHWQGHLAVLSYESPGDRDEHGALRKGWDRLAAELRRLEPASRPVIGSAQPVMADLNADTDILWVRWPQLLSMGLFWFESSALGGGFARDADHQAVQSTAQEWATSHAEDHALVEFSQRPQAPRSAKDYNDSEQLEEL
jgi:hypothetical protein